MCCCCGQLEKACRLQWRPHAQRPPAPGPFLGPNGPRFAAWPPNHTLAYENPQPPQIFRLMRTLVELCGTLEEVPEKRHIFMRLTYQVGGCSTQPAFARTSARGRGTISMRAPIAHPLAQASTKTRPPNLLYAPRRTTRRKATSRRILRPPQRSRPTRPSPPSPLA